MFQVKKLSETAVIPSRGSPDAAGYDLSASKAGMIEPGKWALVPTDLAMKIPQGHYGRIAPRSGLAWKNGIFVNAGVIDSDYRGHVQAILYNTSSTTFVYQAGDRIAQLILEQISTPDVLVVDDFEQTARGQGGFGSTGK